MIMRSTLVVSYRGPAAALDAGRPPGTLATSASEGQAPTAGPPRRRLHAITPKRRTGSPNGRAGPAAVREGRPGCAAVSAQIRYAAGYPWTGRCWAVRQLLYCGGRR